MSIDPARLARIRARLVAAAAITTTAAGCAKPIINDRMSGPPEETINEPPREEQHPINDRMKEPPAAPTADPTQPQPDATTPPGQSPIAPHHVNTPKPADGGAKFNPPDPGQTINTAPDQR
ncbi:hypothetical protein [Polyangium fumosum]|uniref:Uncharacterized protein n=1 Tax=Polyangium fumosum TaxID=889272 RepID=A0A4V5PNC8_9BACT|nr:hypothetical protein [Polyangium fumosum]TKD11906.1 hypothetical protein E8A74_07195 [Polyangium fumosum]